LLHFLHWRRRTIVLDRLDFWTLFLEDRQHLNLLLARLARKSETQKSMRPMSEA
jgi:hypothetical protein